MCAWVHAASISGASRRRRRQSVAAPPSAPAITPPVLTPFDSLSLSLSRSLSRSRSRFSSFSLCVSPCLRFSVSRLSIWISLPPTLQDPTILFLSLVYSLCVSLSLFFISLSIRRARNLRKSSRRHLPLPFPHQLFPVFQRKEIEKFSANMTPFSQKFYFSFSLAVATTRAERLLYC